jgi:Flp pilus assembly protein TadD
VRAERDYRDALAFNPHYALAAYHLGMLLHVAGKTEEARRELAAFAAEWKDADPTVLEVKQAANLRTDSGGAPRP